ncbi:hypothetical protein JW926_11810 [Candidatus Sumerlaeota bacterium]|nr:hypothetical protein [Candidatus Sumerlaeota bacterium]
MSDFFRRFLLCVFLGVAGALLTACIGIYDNTENFLNPPGTGKEEISVLTELGTPSLATTVEDKKVYVYKVRDVKYIILVGIYEGYDLVITCRDGLVEESRKVPRPRAFTLFNPVPWAVAD